MIHGSRICNEKLSTDGITGRESCHRGAGDCLLDRGGPWLWTGYGFRTEIEAHAEIQRFFDIELLSIRLTDSRFYHIDTCFCPLTDGFLMYHPPAFDFDSRIAIESRVPPHKRIVVDTADAGNFACNAVNVEKPLNFGVRFNFGSESVAGP